MNPKIHTYLKWDSEQTNDYVGHREVGDEAICDVLHPSTRCNDPYHKEVADDGDDAYRPVEDAKQHDYQQRNFVSICNRYVPTWFKQ